MRLSLGSCFQNKISAMNGIGNITVIMLVSQENLELNSGGVTWGLADAVYPSKCICISVSLNPDIMLISGKQVAWWEAQS